MTNYENQLKEIVKNDDYIISLLKAVEQLNLNDAWISAGLIRNKVWDVLHNINTPINDIDVIYFDSTDTSWETEKNLEKKLGILVPNQPWSVKNQARMHMKNGFLPYNSSFDGVAHFTEIPTAIAVKICHSELKIMAPYGLEDLFEKIVKPTPYYQNKSELSSIYTERMQDKKWDTIWIDLSIEV
ncbi:nucleotidyltransferase family protein [Viridibacillus sp. NPDC093762]|uniref:nucleotidyltransferase family protein n=1 Tax=Viridibacillus sp. NPDC093762 TaxID=3390720 RepID=UPI003D04814C